MLLKHKERQPYRGKKAMKQYSMNIYLYCVSSSCRKLTDAVMCWQNGKVFELGPQSSVHHDSVEIVLSSAARCFITHCLQELSQIKCTMEKLEKHAIQRGSALETTLCCTHTQHTHVSESRTYSYLLRRLRDNFPERSHVGHICFRTHVGGQACVIA